MPTYEYACKDCGEHLEVVQSFRDDALTECPSCQGRLRKVFSAAGLIFKGSGWHVKDYAGKGQSSASQGSKDETSSSSPSDSSGGTEGGSSTKSEGSSSTETSTSSSSSDSAEKKSA